MSKTKHINVIIGHIKVAVPCQPDSNLMALTTQITEQARKLTGFRECTTTLGKIPAPTMELQYLRVLDKASKYEKLVEQAKMDEEIKAKSEFLKQGHFPAPAGSG